MIRALMLLACVPLLQPPGFCVCRASERVGTPSPVEIIEHASCCHHKHCEESAPPQPRPADSDCPARHDDSHMPGCPASVGVDRFKWIEPTLNFDHALALAEPAAIEAVVAVPASHQQIDTPAFWPSAPPLYLSLCTFVI